MSEFITNISAFRTEDGNIAVSWNWPTGYKCVRVFFLHLMKGRDPADIPPEELNTVSDLCFIDEFRTAGARYIYPLSGSSAGLLQFRVYCCEQPDSPEYDKFSGTVRITGITLNVRYTVTEKKSGKAFRKVTFGVMPDSAVEAGALAYTVTPPGAKYTIHAEIPQGGASVGPVIVPALSSVELCLADCHEEEFNIILNS